MEFKDVEKVLVANNYKITRQRKIIFEALKDNADRHVTPEMLYDIVKEYDDAIGIATVYRTLQTFEDLNLVYKTNFDAYTNYYELAEDPDKHRHHHLICTDCEKIFEVQEDLLEDLEHKVETEYNFEIHDHSVKFFGLCSECQSKNKSIKESKWQGEEPH